MVSSSEFEKIKMDLRLPEDLTLGDITTFLKYGDPIVIGLGGSAASGKTTTGKNMVKMLTYIGRPAVYIKFPTEDSYFGKKLYERLNYKKGETGKYPSKGDNVLCKIIDVDWESGTAALKDCSMTTKKPRRRVKTCLKMFSKRTLN
jgi:hypothetical protein